MNRGHTLRSDDVAKVKPFTDKRVNARTVPCPVCKAEIEQTCTTVNGKLTRHEARRRMAVRKLREEQA